VADKPDTRVELLGGFRVLTSGRHGFAPGARQQELVAYLVLHARDAPVPRQRIAGSLWPESREAQALTNLRRELHHLREGCPEVDAMIDTGTRTLTWCGPAVDVIAFEAASARGLAGDAAALQDAARLYGGDLLPDCSAEWIEPDRERLRQQATNVLTRLVATLENDRAFAGAIDAAQRLLRLDPLDEDAWCALMRCHARRGERAAALHLYQQCAALLKKELGIQPSAATRITYREVLEIDSEAPAVPSSPRTSVYPLVGRRAEWQAVLDAWRAAEAGRSRLLIIRGEAGIGKSRLAEELVDWCGRAGVRALTARCYAGEGRLAYAPIAAWLRSESLQPALTTLAPEWLTDIARLHPDVIASRPDVPAPERQIESWQRLRFFDALAQAFRSAAPILLVLDDIQWADADTLEWLQYFVRSAAGARCLIVATVRAGEEQDNPVLGSLLDQLGRDDHVRTIALGPLDPAATAELAGAVAEQPLDAAALDRAFRETEGHPLFIVELGRMQQGNRQGGAHEETPSRVQAVVSARLALLSPEALATAEIAAAVGRDFTFDVLSRVTDLEEDVLVRALDELWRRHIVRVQAGERWDFTHDRVREVAYSGIGPARARLIHRRIAQAMELLFAERLDEASAAVAVHLDRGGQPARAVPFLERAADVATRVSANEEAIRCLTYALTLLQRLPAGKDRDERELSLRSSLSVALNSARGYAAIEVEENLDRVLRLSRAGRKQVPVRWLWAEFTLRFMLGDLKGTREISEQALERSVSDPSCRCEAHHAMAGTLSSMGELEASRQHFEAALDAYDERRPQRSALGSDLGVFAHAWYSHALWLLGEEEAALAHSSEAVALARRLDHAYSQTLSLAYAALLHQMRREPDRVMENARAVVASCEQYGFAYYGDWARVLMGWAHAQDRPGEGVEAIESALGRLDAKRAQARRPYYMSLLAEAHKLAGNGDRAAAVLDSAIRLANERLDVWWLPALYLERGELEPPPHRHASIARALALARAQHGRGLEQRIARHLLPDRAREPNRYR
jgi:DNA-binding SARP family transcriptional activator/predicted ATPase